MKRKLEDRIICITGASKGIGLGCAKICLRHGAKVAITARNARAPEEELKAEGFDLQSVLFLDCDVRDAGQVEATIGRTIQHFGQLDGIINNAGWHPPPQSIEATSLQDFEDLVRLNLTSTFLGCKYATPHLKKTRGAIVNMSSKVGLMGQADASAYVTTKAGQIGLTKALALDLAKDGVRVNAVCPAGVLTPLVEEWAGSLDDPAAAMKMIDELHPIGRMATIEEMGEVCAFLLSDEASFITGQAICPDGGAGLGYRR